MTTEKKAESETVARRCPPLIAKKLIDVYWRFYWMSDLELAAQTVELMRAAGIDNCGRITERTKQ